MVTSRGLCEWHASQRRADALLCKVQRGHAQYALELSLPVWRGGTYKDVATGVNELNKVRNSRYQNRPGIRNKLMIKLLKQSQTLSNKKLQTWVQVMHSKNVPQASSSHIEHLGESLCAPFLRMRLREPLVAAAAASKLPYLGLYLRVRARGEVRRVQVS